MAFNCNCDCCDDFLILEVASMILTNLIASLW